MNQIKNADHNADDSLEAMIERAKLGDTKAAREVLHHLALSLWPHEENDNPPLPKYARKYLAESLLKIATGDVDANMALHIKTAHAPKKHDFVHLKRAAILMRSILIAGAATDEGKLMTKVDAAQEAANRFNTQHPEARLTMSAVKNFYDENFTEVDQTARQLNKHLHKIQ